MLSLTSSSPKKKIVYACRLSGCEIKMSELTHTFFTACCLSARNDVLAENLSKAGHLSGMIN